MGMNVCFGFEGERKRGTCFKRAEKKKKEGLFAVQRTEGLR